MKSVSALHWCIVLLTHASSFFFFRSRSIDSAPLETSSEAVPEVAEASKDVASVAEQKVEESAAPAVVKTLQTSPDLNFASEVASTGCDPSV